LQVETVPHPALSLPPMWDAAKISDTLQEITRVQGELAAARRAPPSHEEQSALARAQLERAGDQFQRQPFRVTHGPAAYATALLGAMMHLVPMAAVEAVEKAIKAGPPGLDRETRAARISACESKIAELIDTLSQDDLRQMRREKDERFTVMRSQAARREELQQQVDRRALAIETYRQEREVLRRRSRRVAYMGDQPQLTRDERDVAGEAADQWLREAERDLAADIRTLDQVQQRHRSAAGDWRRCCLWVEQLEKLLPVLPAAAD